MEHTLASPLDLTETWRRAAIVVGALAAVELVMLVLLAGALLAKPAVEGATGKAQAAATTKKKTKTRPAPAAQAKPAPVAVAERPRAKVSVLVLNGNGVQGAAASLAQRVTRKGYRIGGVANAPTGGYTRTLVMYRPGFAGEGRRLAKDLGIAIVGPLDGMRASQLHGAHTVVVLGA